MTDSYLHPGLPAPVPQPDGLDAPFWEGLRSDKLLLQRCNDCNGWQWGPEWCCHRCHSFDLRYEETPAEGILYSHERVWHPVHPALAEQGPYVVVLVELPQADGVSPGENQRLFDAYVVMQAQQELQLSDEQYPKFLAAVRTLQSARQRGLAERGRMLQGLRRLDAAPSLDEAAVRTQMKALADHDARVAGDVRDALAAIDQVLDLRQQVALVHDGLAVGFLRPRAVDQLDRLRAESHRAAEILDLFLLGKQVDHGMRRLGIHLGRVRAVELEHVP